MTPGYFDRYENLAMERTESGILTVRLHTAGGPIVFTGQTHHDLPRAFAEIGDDRENKVVMLLSDGGPNYLDCAQTYVADYETHRRVIRSANTQGAVIHVFGIGLDPDTRGFMMNVASENSGTFRELD